jgi:hypothetical protein
MCISMSVCIWEHVVFFLSTEIWSDIGGVVIKVKYDMFESEKEVERDRNIYLNHFSLSI